VEIRREDGGILVRLVSEDGRYRAMNLPPGSYVVQEFDPVGYSSTTPNKVQAWVRANTVMQVDFGDISNDIKRPYRQYVPVLQRWSRGL
jgi:hypothetical protein